MQSQYSKQEYNLAKRILWLVLVNQTSLAAGAAVDREHVVVALVIARTSIEQVVAVEVVPVVEVLVQRMGLERTEVRIEEWELHKDP